MRGGIEARALCRQDLLVAGHAASDDCNERRVTAVKEKVNKYRVKNHVRKYDALASSAQGINFQTQKTTRHVR